MQAQEIIYDTAALDTIANIYDLSEPMQGAWETIMKQWYVSDFKKILKENKIKIGCGGISNNECESLFVDVIIKINEKGKLEYYKLINGKKCGEPISKPTEIRLMREFFKIEFPEELRNIKFQTRLGSVLSC